MLYQRLAARAARIAPKAEKPFARLLRKGRRRAAKRAGARAPSIIPATKVASGEWLRDLQLMTKAHRR